MRMLREPKQLHLCKALEVSSGLHPCYRCRRLLWYHQPAKACVTGLLSTLITCVIGLLMTGLLSIDFLITGLPLTLPPLLLPLPLPLLLSNKVTLWQLPPFVPRRQQSAAVEAAVVVVA